MGGILTGPVVAEHHSPGRVARLVRNHIPPALKVIVAGGLTPGNVAEAVHALRPDVVDVSSGVELNVRRKDPGLIRAFVRNARREK